VGRPRNRRQDVIQKDAANLLRIGNWKAEARYKVWRKKVGETMARKKAEVLWKKNIFSSCYRGTGLDSHGAKNRVSFSALLQLQKSVPHYFFQNLN
jgi:hypothetical protein